GRWFTVFLHETAVVFGALDGNRRLPVPRLLQRAEVSERVDLRRLLAGFCPGVVLLQIEYVRGARKARGRLWLLHVGSAERRQGHRVGTHVRKLVDLGFLLGKMPRAARERR